MSITGAKPRRSRREEDESQLAAGMIEGEGARGVGDGEVVDREVVGIAREAVVDGQREHDEGAFDGVHPVGHRP